MCSAMNRLAPILSVCVAVMALTHPDWGDQPDPPAIRAVEFVHAKLHWISRRYGRPAGLD